MNIENYSVMSESTLVVLSKQISTWITEWRLSRSYNAIMKQKKD
jgi:hypothetical protein